LLVTAYLFTKESRAAGFGLQKWFKLGFLIDFDV
jgi:hypothetical protein